MKRIFFLTIALLFGLTPTVNAQMIKSINTPIMDELDEVSPFSEGLAAIRKGNQWGFMDANGKLVIDFRSDLVWNPDADKSQSDVTGISYPKFSDGMCMTRGQSPEGIPLYGFINTKGEQIIENEFVNITPFKDAKAIGIYAKKTFRGQNEIKLEVFDYSFIEVLINTKGEILWPIRERDHILMSPRRFELPLLRSKLLTNDLLTAKNDKNQWEIYRINL